MYVCLLVLCMYVCMSVSFMYVCLYVCMYVVKAMEAEEELLALAKSQSFQKGNKLVVDDDQLYDDYGNPLGKNLRKVDSLPQIDHSNVKYQKFRKNFFKEHAEMKKITGDTMRKFYEDNQINLSGGNTPRPCIEFKLMSLPPILNRKLSKQGFEKPTPVQACAIPCVLSGRDLVGIAKTGSGKTLAFVLPLLVHVKDQAPLAEEDGPIALIIGPTRELAHQIYLQANKMQKGLKLTIVPCFGGMNKHEQVRALQKGCHIVVGTPGRIIDVVKDGATNLMRVTFLVLDEADKMFRMGFEKQVRSITGQIRPDRQVLLFSATFPPRIEALARDILVNPVRLTVGTVGAANSDIRQVVDVVRPMEKWGWLQPKLNLFVQQGQVLIFVSTKVACEELSRNLQLYQKKAGCIHGDKTQHERMEILRKFKSKTIQILVATDVAARGLDIRGLKTVINYDMARDIDSHVHRVGRTGRAGENGVAYTLFTTKDERLAGALVQSLEMANQKVPDTLVAIARASGTLRQSYSRRGGVKRKSGNITGGLGSTTAGYSKVHTAEQAAGRSRKTSAFVKAAVANEKKKKLFGSLAQMATQKSKPNRNKKRKNARRMGEGEQAINFQEKAYSLTTGGGSLRTKMVRAQFASSFCEASKNDLEDQFRNSNRQAETDAVPQPFETSGDFGRRVSSEDYLGHLDHQNHREHNPHLALVPSGLASSGASSASIQQASQHSGQPAQPEQPEPREGDEGRQERRRRKRKSRWDIQ
ncbi:hypothetical protein AAMO2058_001362300 [Amorphochlora amoebiformis]